MLLEEQYEALLAHHSSTSDIPTINKAISVMSSNIYILSSLCISFFYGNRAPEFTLNFEHDPSLTIPYLCSPIVIKCSSDPKSEA